MASLPPSFHKPGTIGPITADQPCIVLLRQHDRGGSLAVVDPTQTLEQITVTLSEPSVAPTQLDPAIKVQATAPLRLAIDMRHALGMERTVQWSR